MKALKSLSKAVPMRARVMFIVGLAVMGGALFFIWDTLTGSNEAEHPQVTTGAEVETSVSKITRAKPGEQTVIPETSPMMQELENTKKEEMHNAETGTQSYIESLEFKQKERARVIESERAANAPTQETGIDDIIAKRNRERANAQQNKNSGAAAQTPIFDEALFLKTELDSAKATKESFKRAVTGIRDSGSGFVAVSNYKDSESENAQSNAEAYDGKFVPRYAKNGSGSKSGERDFASQVTDVGSAKIETKTLNRGKRYYSVLNIGINTDEISPTTATVIEGGDLIGAEFIAETPVRAGEKSVVIFNSMSVGGKDYTVRAIALDPETQRSGLADNVNRHIMERYLKLGIAAFVDGYAESLQDSTTTISPEGSSTTQTSAVPDGATQTKIAVGKVGEAFVPAFEEEFKRPPTVEVYGGREVVIMLLDPIELPKDTVVKEGLK